MGVFFWCMPNHFIRLAFYPAGFQPSRSPLTQPGGETMDEMEVGYTAGISPELEP